MATVVRDSALRTTMMARARTAAGLAGARLGPTGPGRAMGCCLASADRAGSLIAVPGPTPHRGRMPAPPQGPEPPQGPAQRPAQRPGPMPDPMPEPGPGPVTGPTPDPGPSLPPGPIRQPGPRTVPART